MFCFRSGFPFTRVTQIAFLWDAYREKVARYGLSHFALFVTYFPHLIAGPILYHKDHEFHSSSENKTSGSITI